MPPKTASLSTTRAMHPGAMRALELTAKEAMALGHNYIGCEHILLGVLATEDTMGAQVLHRMGVDMRICSARGGLSAVRLRARDGADAAERRPPATDAGLEEILRRLEAIEQRLGSE